MLILHRRIGEAITIDGDIKVWIYGIHQGHVKIGVEAPGNITIIRDELFIKKEGTNSHDREHVKAEP